MKRSEDKKWLKIALEEGKKGVGLTAPNPPVGAVLVKNGCELARGWHQKAGSAHAEREALAKLKEGEAVGATAYVTLEPCSTHGKTGACVEALIKAGISRVVYGARDPNPDHAGAADEILKKAGIEVESGLCEEECAHLIRGFGMVQKEGRPWVIAKTAMSLDGRITRRKGEGQWLTGPEAREKVQLLRAEVDAIVTSGETLRQDDPALTLRSDQISKAKRQVWRAVMTQKKIIQEKYQIFTDEFKDRSFILSEKNEYDNLRTLAKNYQVQKVLLEAGGGLLGAFSDQHFIDEWVIFIAPMVLGGPKVALGGEGSARLEERFSLKNIIIEQVGQDLCARGIVDRDGPQPLLR